jgi:hypothetical protein
VIALAAGGCGQDTGTPASPSPGQVVARYYASAQDPAARCSTLSKTSLGRFGGAENCRQRTIPSATKAAGARIEAQHKQGRRSCVRFAVAGGGTGVALLVREADAWKIDRFDSAGEPSTATAKRCAAKDAAEEERERELEEAGGEGKPKGEKEREKERELKRESH